MKAKTKWTKLFSILLCCVMLVGLLPTVAFADSGDVEISMTNFPDSNFKAVVTKYDTNHDAYLSEAEIASVKEIDVSGKSISNLKGIEHFTSLEKLKCGSNSLTALDISQNTALKYLDCSNNKISALDLSNNVNLETLYCGSNKLSSLDVTKNTALKVLSFPGNTISSIDLSKNTGLVELLCYKTNLTSLNLSNNPQLNYLDCHYNQISSLDVSKCNNLEYLDCVDNNLSALNLTNNTSLEQLSIGGNPMISIDLSKNTALTTLWCENSNFTSLDLSKNTALTKLSCYSGKLTELDLSNNTALQTLDCHDNSLEVLDISKNVNLTSVKASSNKLTSIDITNNTKLDSIHLDVTNNEYSITVGSDRRFNLTSLPGDFDSSRVVSWNGATSDGDILTVDDGLDTVTYNYGIYSDDIGYRTFTLKITVDPTKPGVHVHKYEDYSSDESYHWYECTDESCPDKAGSIKNKATHAFKEVIDKEATETETGLKHEECKVCGYKKAAVEIPKIEHTHKYGEWEPYDDTYHQKTCACTDKIREEHDYDEIIDKPATATEAGLKHYKCSVCEYETKPVETPKLTIINEITVTGVTPPSVGAMPTTVGISLGKGIVIDDFDTFWMMWQYNSAEDYYYYTDMVGDDFVDELPFKTGEQYALNIFAYLEESCSFAEGMKVYYNGIELPAGTESMYRDKDASYYEIDGDGIWINIAFDKLADGGHTHEYGAWTPDDETTHSKECACTDKITKPHNFIWVIDKEATATEKGSKHEECSVCGYKKAAVEIPATGSGTGTTKPTDPSKPGQTNPDTGVTSPQTGDNSHMALWIALLVASVFGIAGTAVYSRRKRVR